MMLMYLMLLLLMLLLPLLPRRLMTLRMDMLILVRLWTLGKTSFLYYFSCS